MPLEELSLHVGKVALPANVRLFLKEARRRIERFQRSHHIPGFIAGDFARIYSGLHAVVAADLAAGSLFCEWGSGFGVVACLAAMLDFEACGIEIEGDLVDAARELAADFALPVEFVCGSFIPGDGEPHADVDDDFAWLTTDTGSTLDELGLAHDDFSAVYAYPWPDEEHLIGDLFERHAAPDALLITFHGGDAFRVRRKTG